jgi:hypothetical protein
MQHSLGPQTLVLPDFLTSILSSLNHLIQDPIIRVSGGTQEDGYAASIFIPEGAKLTRIKKLRVTFHTLE